MKTSQAGEHESLATERSIENVTAPSYLRRDTAPQWHPVVRSPEQLRLHPAMKEFGWTGVIDELNDATRLKDSVPQQVLITTNGTILAGFGHWRLAMLEGRHEINCIEHQLSGDEALQFILAHHQTRYGWNDFVRIRLALTLELNLQQRALDNMRAGGKFKGSTNLSEADRVDVREKIARRAGTGIGNVGKVKAILRSAHPNIITALQNGLLSIHRAWLWSKLPKLEQRAEFARYEEGHTQRKILNEFLPKPASASLDPVQVIEALQRLEARQPGCIDIRTSRRLRRTVVILGQDLSGAQKELDWHA
jgi:hypothetical protein